MAKIARNAAKMPKFKALALIGNRGCQERPW